MTMALLAVGCGAGTSLVSSSHTSARAARRLAVPVPAIPAPGQQSLPAPGPSGVPAAATDVNVIRAWSDALRHGDVHGAAAYFALPSVMVNGSDAAGGAFVIAIQTRAEADAANATLPCGARLVSAEQRGRFVNALFRLTGRPGPGGTSCAGGVGSTARTNFVIAHGRIVEWLRAPDDPGDNGTPQAPQAPQPVPAPGPVLPPSGPTV
jgi:hypothetical protein